jgi:hypothetical protein
MTQSCDRALVVELDAYLDEPEAPRWAEFHEHARSCAVCSAEIRAWQSLRVSVVVDRAEDHPREDALLAYADSPDALAQHEIDEIEAHLAHCAGCGDEVGVLRKTWIEPQHEREEAKSGAARVVVATLAALRRLVWHPAFAYALVLILLVPTLGRLGVDTIDVDLREAAPPRGAAIEPAPAEHGERLRALGYVSDEDGKPPVWREREVVTTASAPRAKVPVAELDERQRKRAETALQDSAAALETEVETEVESVERSLRENERRPSALSAPYAADTGTAAARVDGLSGDAMQAETSTAGETWAHARNKRSAAESEEQRYMRSALSATRAIGSDVVVTADGVVEIVAGERAGLSAGAAAKGIELRLRVTRANSLAARAGRDARGLVVAGAEVGELEIRVASAHGDRRIVEGRFAVPDSRGASATHVMRIPAGWLTRGRYVVTVHGGSAQAALGAPFEIDVADTAEGR